MNSAVGSVIGWAAVCDTGVLIAKSKAGGSNINAEIFAIRDLLTNIINYRKSMLKNAGDCVLEIITDSKTSLQIIAGMQKDPGSYDLSLSENYVAAANIVSSINTLKNFGFDVTFTHIHGHRDEIGNVFADYVATTESNKLLEKLL